MDTAVSGSIMGMMRSDASGASRLSGLFQSTACVTG